MSNEEPEGCVHADEHFAYTVVADGLRLCGCGNPDAILAEVLDVLRACPLWEGRWNPDPEAWGSLGAELLLHAMDSAELIEHGTSVGGSWATPKGERFLAVMDGKPESFLDHAPGYSCSHCPVAANLEV